MKKERDFFDDEPMPPKAEEDLDFNYNESPAPDMKEGEAVMSSFFALARRLKKLDLKWKGRSIRDGKEVLTHDPVGSDRFVDSLLTSVESIVSSDNSISTMDEENANIVKWEKYDAFTRACVQARFRGEFNEGSFTLLKEEYDHIIQLFMGHVVNSHGIDSAYRLQGGVIAAMPNPHPNASMLEIGKQLLQNK